MGQIKAMFKTPQGSSLNVNLATAQIKVEVAQATDGLWVCESCSSFSF